MELDVHLRALAERQHGVMARHQARAVGATRQHLRRRVEAHDWEAMTPGVLRLVGSQRTFRQRCMAATLDAGSGAAVSHESAAALWRLPGFGPGPMHVTRTNGRSSLATVHRSDLPDRHRRTFEAIPVTSPARTIFDLAGVLHPGRTERALDNALARGLTSIEALHSVTEALAGHGRHGSALMRRLIAGRNSGYAPPESNLEARFHTLAERAGLHSLVRQCDVGGERWVGRADYLDRSKAVVIEIDSDLHHTSLVDASADGLRDKGMVEAGYTVVRITEFDVWHRPQEVLRRLVAL